MREKWPAVKHRLDGWHVGKDTGKKIDALAKKKDCAVLQKWKKSIVFWCAASSNDDDGDLKEAKWVSITNHIMDKHSGHENPVPQVSSWQIARQGAEKKVAQTRICS